MGGGGNFQNYSKLGDANKLKWAVENRKFGNWPPYNLKGESKGQTRAKIVEILKMSRDKISVLQQEFNKILLSKIKDKRRYCLFSQFVLQLGGMFRPQDAIMC